jgi:beta-xylosidase
MRTLSLLFFVILLCACNALPQTTISPTETAVSTQTAPPTIVPSPTITEDFPADILLLPTVDLNFFRDDFSEALADGWTWVREDPRNWSLTTIPGSLQINVGKGYVPAHANSNLLLRSAPNGNFRIETQIDFEPDQNFQFAGLIMYESDSNFIQAGRAYCSAVGCIGEGLYMDYYRRGVVVKPDFGQTYEENAAILIRLSRRENTYNFELSTDGRVWFVIGTHTSDINPLQIGLVAGQNLGASFPAAEFDYFEVHSLP